MARPTVIPADNELRAFAPFDRFAQLKESAGVSLPDVLVECAKLRADNLQTSIGWQLTSRDLSRTGEHPEFGTVTLRQLLSTWVAHDLGHVAQTARVRAKQYRDDVGPWGAYLLILDR